MSSDSLISIILPVKNGGDFFRNCLESIIGQQLDGFKMELLIVDDHSDDASLEIAQEFSQKHAFITSHENPGQGVLDALNQGYRLSKGNLISRMDADDLMPDDKMLILWRTLMANNGVDVATGKVEYFSTTKELNDGYRSYEQWLNMIVDQKSWRSNCYKECVIASPNWLTTRESFESIGGFGSNYPEDYDLVFRMIYGGLKITASDQITHLWRDHDTRTSRTSDLYLDNTFLELKMKYFLKEENQPEQSLILIGAGKKGKKIARMLQAAGKSFSWMTNNPNKSGHVIYDVILEDENQHSLSPSNKYLIAVANHDEQRSLFANFEGKGLEMGRHFFPFS